MYTNLFGRTSLNDYFKAIQKQMVDDLNNIPIEEIANADVDRLASDLTERYCVVLQTLAKPPAVTVRID